MSKTWKNEVILEPDGKSGMLGGAWCTSFVYSNKGNFLIKGYLRETQKYLEGLKSKGTKFIVNYNLHFNGKNRNIWSHSNDNVSIKSPRYKCPIYGTCKWEVYTWKDGKKTVLFSAKRLPKRWIEKFNIK